jgi:hypothetical protein
LKQNGMPPLDARHYPLPLDRKWYEGKGLRTSNRVNRLRGRQEELGALRDIVAACQTEKASAIAVTGIGGIGYVSTISKLAGF